MSPVSAWQRPDVRGVGAGAVAGRRARALPGRAGLRGGGVRTPPGQLHAQQGIEKQHVL